MSRSMKSKEKKFVWRTQKSANDDMYVITIIGKDRPDMFVKSVGALTWNNFDIADAKSFRQDSKTLDIFKVRAILNGKSPSEQLNSAEQDLSMAISGDFNLIEQVRSKAVSNAKKYSAASDTHISMKNNWLDYTVINITAKKDFPGILFLISDTLYHCNVHILSAQIETRNEEVQDMFYIRNHTGEVLNRSKQSDVKGALKQALP